MKFKSIALHNFMRYKGDNRLEFSCDEEKNVTVVLGNNTFGKTTLAQAFRWGLYGPDELSTTSYTKKKDIVLLNHDVVSTMNASSVETVSVEIVIVDGKREWKFTRQTKFRRKGAAKGSLSVEPTETKLTMIEINDGVAGPIINNDGHNPGPYSKDYSSGCVQDKINSMLPQQLANYFFFDGERWSDPKTSKEDTKSAINTILGITGLLEMKSHLRDGYTNVLKTLREKIKGDGKEYEELVAKIKECELEIAQYEKIIANKQAEFEAARKDKERLEEELSSKRGIEEDAKKYASLEQDIERLSRFLDGRYADIVREFGEKAARYFAGSMLPELSELLSHVQLEGKDIPGVTTDTVDYLIRLGKCLCGEDLAEGTPAYQNLMQLRKLIPPEMIGGAAGKFQDTIAGWLSDSSCLEEKLVTMAEEYESMLNEIEDKKDEMDRLGRSMDRQTDVKALRKRYETFKRLCREAEEQKNAAIYNRDAKTKEHDKLVRRLEVIAKQDEANKSINLAIAYAQTLYDLADRIAQKKQNGVFEELNQIIGENFSRMFNDTEKYAVLEDDYRIHVYYYNVGGITKREETNLSNGEATAINFVYIVSLLELAKRRSAPQDDDENEDTDNGVLQLPLVLDGPFSALSNDNTQLIAKKLPEFAEQVIIFMLDKDWESSGLDAFTLPGYCIHISKEEKSNSASLEKGGVDFGSED